jgi:hypothetical protein
MKMHLYIEICSCAIDSEEILSKQFHQNGISKQSRQAFHSNAYSASGSTDFSFHRLSILCHIYWQNLLFLGTFTATPMITFTVTNNLTMKNAVFWDVMSRGS